MSKPASSDGGRTVHFDKEPYTQDTHDDLEDRSNDKSDDNKESEDVQEDNRAHKGKQEDQKAFRDKLEDHQTPKDEKEGCQTKQMDSPSLEGIQEQQDFTARHSAYSKSLENTHEHYQDYVAPHSASMSSVNKPLPPQRKSKKRNSFKGSSKGEFPLRTLSDWREARMNHDDQEDQEVDHTPHQYPHISKDFHRKGGGKAYCGHCGKMVRVKVGKNLNNYCLISTFVVVLLCPIFILCAWIPLLCIDIRTHAMVCLRCGNEVGQHLPKSKLPKMNGDSKELNDLLTEKDAPKRSNEGSVTEGDKKSS